MQYTYSMITYEDKITAEEFLALRAHVGWVELPLEEARVCVEKVYFIICARDGEKAIGVARLMWDGGYMAFLSDVIVDENYRGLGIGRKLVESCIEKLQSDLKPGFKVKMTLNSAPGKEPFYEKFGFEVRPNDHAGCSLDKWITAEK